MKKILFAVLAAMVLAVPAFAQTYAKSSVSNGNFNVRAGTINSATAVTAGKLFDVGADAYVVVQGTTAGSAVLTPELSDGSASGKAGQTIPVYTTPTIVSFTAPLPFQAIRVSPSATLSSTNSVSVKIIQTK